MALREPLSSVSASRLADRSGSASTSRDLGRPFICRRTIPLFVFLLALVLPMGCRAPAAQETDVGSVPPSELRHSTQPAAIGSNDHAAKARRVPVVLHSRFNPTPLTDEQMDEILDDARQMARKGQDAWFILLKNNSERDGVPSWSRSTRNCECSAA